MKKFLKREQKGITLIALVITIIVLLILAGVSIAMLTGENGILTQANNAKVENAKGQTEEKVKLAVGALKIEESTKEMTQEEKRKILEGELKKQQADATVTINGTGFLVNYGEYEVEIDNQYAVLVYEQFNAEEWDKTATPDDYFEWDEAGTTIIGYKDTLAGNEEIRIPSKCIAIKTDSVWNNNASTRSVISGGVKKIELPDTITEIGDCAFAQFKDLVSINIPRRVTTIGNRVFSVCNSLTSIEIPNSVTSIGNQVFDSCSSLTSATISNNLTEIKSGMFVGCSKLTSITIPNSVTIIESGAFRGCSSLTSIIIPNDVMIISAYTFMGCSNLISVTIPNGVTDIGNFAFCNCTGLTSVIIPDSVTNIGEYAFSNCTSLSNIIIPEGVTSIEWLAFSGCTGLTTITIPESVTSIDTNAFLYTSDTLVYNVVQGSYADTWVQANKYENQTINYINE